MKRLSVVVAVVMMFGSVGHAAAAAGPEGARDPVRSGSIIGGFLVMAGETGPDCFETPDCRVWLESDCDPRHPRLSDPALYTSIVDVANLPGSRRQRTFRMKLSCGYGVGWGGISVQFWNAACSELHPSATRASQLTATVGRTRFKIPARAAWMTLASWDTMRLDWTLR